MATPQLILKYLPLEGYFIGLTGFAGMKKRGAHIRQLLEQGALPLQQLMIEYHVEMAPILQVMQTNHQSILKTLRICGQSQTGFLAAPTTRVDNPSCTW